MMVWKLDSDSVSHTNVKRAYKVLKGSKQMRANLGFCSSVISNKLHENTSARLLCFEPSFSVLTGVSATYV